MDRQLLLLGLLLGEKMHGYQLNDYIEHTLGFCTDLKKSTAYYTLGKLEEEGYVRQEVEREGNRPRRRIYEVTPAGRDYFFELLRANLSHFSRTYYADDMGLAFMDQLPADEARSLLAQKRDQARAVLEHLRQVSAHEGSLGYVIEHNVAHLEIEVAWLDDLLERFDGGKDV
jgi:DNA-binding PadR family transcriptional regulator